MLFRWLWTSAQLADAGAFGFRNLLFIDSVAAVIVIIGLFSNKSGALQKEYSIDC